MEELNIREQQEAREEQFLSPFGCLSQNSHGRETNVLLCPVRTEFQRDIDRIVHSKAFRRLKHKTQVFMLPEGDHYRTRMTHTLEVSRIARTIARGLRLNEDLTEAIALGHDLGHAPFGHTGEYVLDELMREARGLNGEELDEVMLKEQIHQDIAMQLGQERGEKEELTFLEEMMGKRLEKESLQIASEVRGFCHNLHSVRTVTRLENLNLTYEVCNGIACHTGSVKADTLEGQIVAIADRIAYLNHDIQDAIRGKVLQPMDLPLANSEVLGYEHGARINRLTMDIIENSMGKNEIRQSKTVGDAMLELRSFMFREVYTNPKAKSEETKAQNMLRQLFRYYCEDTEKLPDFYQGIVDTEGVYRGVCDYIAGMTDSYATQQYLNLFVPHGWHGMEKQEGKV